MFARLAAGLALAATLAGGPLLAQQPAAPRLTVVDYFFLLRSFEGDTRSNRWMIDERNGAVVDVPNGYLHAIGDGAQWPLWICVFRRTDGSHLIAVKWHPSDAPEMTYLKFYRYIDREFIDASESVLPERVHDDRQYELPRRGTTIRVRDARNRPLYDLAWNGQRFERRPAAP
jgi:hypothetical protein